MPYIIMKKTSCDGRTVCVHVTGGLFFIAVFVDEAIRSFVFMLSKGMPDRRISYETEDRANVSLSKNRFTLSFSCQP